MLSGSARATSAAESRFRVEAPNSVARRLAAVALGPRSQAVLEEMADEQPGGITVHLAADLATDLAADLAAGLAAELAAELALSDLVVLVAAAGDDASTVAAVGEVCWLAGVTVMAVVLTGTGAPDPDLARVLAQVRPVTHVLVSTASTDYVGDLLGVLLARAGGPR